MDPDNITPGTLPQDGGDGAVGAVVDAQGTPATPAGDNAFTLDEINSFLGKNFQSKETALKALKDTQSYVGKKTDDFEKELKERGYLSRADLENELFFRDNPAHANNKDLLEAIALKNGTSLKDAAGSESYKKLFDGASNYEKSESLKSVLNPSPRLQQAVDRTANIQQLKASGNDDAAASEAARIVAEMFEINV